MSRRVGLDAGSRAVLLDLIYRLSLDDKASDGEARAPGDGAAKERRGKERSGDDGDDEARRLRARAKDARREDREREKKEKVLHKALKEDRRAERRDKVPGGAGLDDDDDPNRHPHLLDRPKPAGEKIAVTATCASGETKLLQITRADDLESLFKAARSKFKAMKRAPNTARLHAPPGPTLSDTASLAPGAVVFVDFDKEKEATRRTKKRAKEKAAEDETNAEKAEDVAGDASRAVDLVVATARRGGADETTTDGAAERRAPRPPPASFAREGGKNPETPGPGPEAVAAENARLLAAVTRRRAFERDGATRDASNPRDVVELPAHRARDAIVRAVEASSSPVTVLTGETGSGKTTCVPLFVLEHYAAKGFGADANIVVAQPRRVAAISVARRVAEMFGEPVGETVGYAVRGESRMCRRRTRVVFVTTGALLARLATNPDLDGVSHVFVDEIHERTADADFLLAHLRDLLVRRWFPEPSRARPGLSDADVPERGEDGNGKLRVVLMSATMASSALRDYFASAFPPTAPVIPTPRVEGRAFPVEERFADAYARASPRDTRTGEKKKDGGCSRRERAHPRHDAFEAYSRALVASLPPVLAELETIGSGSGASGAGLVFLPGAPEIVRLERVLRDSLPGALRSRLHVVPLHGQLSGAEQQRAFDPAPAGKIKLVLATNVAETSLTIPDVVAVFDSGRSKKLAFDPRTRLSSLKEGWCSLASAAQRKGRAGRVRPGVCVRLYTAAESASNQPATDPPELQTTPLESLVMHAMLVSPERDPETTLAATPDPPPPESVRAATRRLRAVGAAEDAEDAAETKVRGRGKRSKLVLTPLGAHLARLPLEPRLGKMLVYACVLGCLPPILTVAAAVSCKPAFGADPGDKDAAAAAKRRASVASAFGARSDHLAVAAAFDAWSSRGADDPSVAELNLNRAAMRDIRREREALKQRLRESGFGVDAAGAAANGANDDIARCVLAAGLFPNVARVTRGGLRLTPGARNGNGGKTARGASVVRDARGAEVAVHPGSVNGYQGGRGGPPEGFLVYQEAVETSRVFLRDTTAVPAEALLLFGGSISVNHAAGTVSVGAGVEDDGAFPKVEIRAAPEVGVLFKLLRRELDRALLVAAADPGAEHASLQGTPEGRRLMDVLLRLFPGASTR